MSDPPGAPGHSLWRIFAGTFIAFLILTAATSLVGGRLELGMGTVLGPALVAAIVTLACFIGERRRRR